MATFALQPFQNFVKTPFSMDLVCLVIGEVSLEDSVLILRKYGKCFLCRVLEGDLAKSDTFFGPGTFADQFLVHQAH